MRSRSIAVHVLVALVGGVLATGAPAVAAPGDASCTEATRACVIETANRYLAALVHHDGSDVPLHPDARRTENGGDTGSSGEEIRASLGSPIMFVITGIRQLDWLVEGEEAVAFYLLDTVTSPTFIVERFHVRAGLIHEIEAVFAIDVTGYAVGPESATSRPDGTVERATASNHGPLGPVPVGEGNAGATQPPDGAACGETCVREAVQAYMSALSGADPAAVPLTEDARATENRRPTAEGADEVRAHIAQDVATLANVRVIVEGHEAVAFHTVVTEDGTSPVATRFRTVDGMIDRIDVTTAGTVVG